MRQPLSSASRTARDPLPFAVCALGIAQITAWGTSFYFLGVLAAPIAQDTGWSRGLVYFGFTLALLMMGLVSTWSGRAIDRHGGRYVMSVGSAIVSVGLLAISLAQSQAAYLLAWAFLGIGMRLSLYDAAFAALVQVVPSRGRRAISYLTLFGAFASTVFWLLGHALEEALGWRQTLVAFAVINLIVCLPLLWFGLARRESPQQSADEMQTSRTPEGRPLAGRARQVAIVLFSLVMSLNAFVFGVVSVQLVPLLEAAGLATAAAVGVASMKGFAQFGGRIAEIVFARNLHAITVARIAIGLLPLSFGLLWLSGGNLTAIVAFTLLMGASQGVITIVRGAVPLAMFGSKGYGTVLGLLATPVLVVNAAAPTLFALAVETWGWQVAQMVLIVMSAGSWISMEAMTRWYAREEAQRMKAESAAIG